MDSDQFISFFQSSLNSPTLDTDYVSQWDTLAAQPLPQPLCSNQSLALLKAFCSDEDTVKSYLLDGDQLDNHNNLGKQFLHSSIGTLSSFKENWYKCNDSGNPFNSLNTIEGPSPVATPISSYISTDPLAVESLYQSKIHNTYDNLKLNFIALVKRGYKLSLSLNTDNSEVDEPWNPDVSQKILSVSFSSLSLIAEYLSDDTKLNGYETLLMDEACVAFKGQKCMNLLANLNDRRRAKASPDKLISICNGIKGFRKIETSDKITLLSNIYYHLHAMDGIVNYDPTIDGWDAPASDFKFDRRDTFLFNPFAHDAVVHVIETFPDQFRNDINVIILMYLIIIFNGDISGLKHPEIIRHEQFSYIYLLRRYLGTIFESDCEASDNHYRLMAKIEQLRLLTAKAKKELFLLLNEPMEETISKAITETNMPSIF
ncbi:uncharacterized protein LOC112539048 [Tetranychus urticae]|uniref:uncharacterized protein LOC112539048 n=1 Tax=Tetranychus urticae TaxID=32264 RepID=UPI000D64F4A2|nr:uncharacterized protein LOC112539048 [Tetranychus urticae]